MAQLGYSGIEIAPTRVWPDLAQAPHASVASYRLRLADKGFTVPSMQAIYHGLDGVSLFKPETHKHLIKRTIRVATIARTLDCPVLVFGAPRMRDPGNLSAADAVDQAAPILRVLAQIAADFDTKLCIEPNARQYGCRFVWTVAQAAELVRHIDHPGFGLHVDTAAMFLEHENAPAVLREFSPMIQHFHVSEPQLRGLGTSLQDQHANLAALIDTGYSRWVSLESTDTTTFRESASLLSAWSVLPC